MDVNQNENLSGFKALTKREFEVFQYLAQGESISIIASKLNRSVKTMNNHRSSIMKKLDAKNSTHLALMAQREGLQIH
jgi:two-component system invasion response regulator UvrY